MSPERTFTPGSKIVLVVEDSPTQALNLNAVLERAGLQVICATNGRMGIRLAHQVHPDLIVLDVQMPDVNGFEVCEQLKKDKETADIPIIMFTRNDDPQAVQMGLQAGVVDYITKDAFANAVLLETLRQMGLIER
jgi:two-component system sensor histidine kinase/response regulator